MLRTILNTTLERATYWAAYYFTFDFLAEMATYL